MIRRPLTVLSLTALLGGCSLTPAYNRPAMSLPDSFKEVSGWRSAQPSDAVARGAWWELFNDPVLNDLERRVLVSNQTLAANVAAYREAQELVREERAALFPEIDLSARATKAGSFGHGQTIVIDQGTGTSNGGGTGNGNGSGGTGTGGTGGTGSTVSTSSGSSRFSLTATASWEPDLWGRIGASVGQARANAQASLGDLATATLSAQAQLATDYLQLRAADAQAAILADALKAFQRNLQITTNRYNAGVSAKTDVLQAQTQVESAQASYIDIGRQRATLEHAIAVLAGENPSTFAVAPVASWSPGVPEVPAVLPSALIERRPDVAAAERRVAAANQGIGIERSAFFPSIDLSASAGSSASSVAKLFDLSSTIWSLGLSSLTTLLDFGARSARVREARDAFEQAGANYRQTVLTAFQQTEDELAAVRILAAVSVQRQASAADATRVEQLVQNQYLAGQVDYTDVITAQTTALNARETAVQATLDRQVAAVALIEAVGGAWAGSAPVAAQSSVASVSE